MSFFYHTSAEAADFYFLLAVVLLANLLGGARLLAAAVAGAFLADRLSLLFGNPEIMLLIASAGEFAALCIVLTLLTGIRARAVAALFAADLAALFALAVNLIDFETMAAITTVALYLQLILVLSGMDWNGLLALVGPGRARGFARVRRADPLEKWLDADRRLVMSDRNPETVSRMAAEDSELM